MPKNKKEYLRVELSVNDFSTTFYFDKAQTLENFMEKNKYVFWKSHDYNPSMIIKHSIKEWTTSYIKDRVVRNSDNSFKHVLSVMKGVCL